MPADQPVPGNRWDLLGEGPPGGRDVSVVVAHYDQPEQLARTLGALERQTLRPREVVIGDDGSPTPPDPGRTSLEVRVVTQPDLGFRAGAARTLAAGHCRGEILAFLDADTTPAPAYLEVLTRRVAACRDVLAVGRRRHADLAGLPLDADPAAAPALPDPAWLADGYRDTADLLDADGRSFRYVISAVMACRRSLFAELGGFDPRFVGYGGEDWDFAYRAWNAGAVLAHEPGALAWHDGPEWAGRPERADTLDLQTMRLAALIPEPSTRGAPLPAALPDVVADVAADLPPADLVRTVHSLLRQTHRDLRVGLHPASPPAVLELYGPDVGLGSWSEDQLARCRARLEVRSPLPTDAVAAAVDLLTGEDLGVVEITTGGRPAATLSSTRAIGRARRWADRLPPEAAQELFGARSIEVGAAPPERRTLAGWLALP